LQQPQLLPAVAAVFICCIAALHIDQNFPSAMLAHVTADKQRKQLPQLQMHCRSVLVQLLSCGKASTAARVIRKRQKMAVDIVPQHIFDLLRRLAAAACWVEGYLQLLLLLLILLLLLLLLAHLQAMITSCPRCSSCRASSNPIPVNQVKVDASVQRHGRLRMSIL
jgi:hypothetical protein